MKKIRIGSFSRETAKIIRKLVKDTLSQAKNSDLFAVAGSLSYTTILAIVPMLAVLFYVSKALGLFEYGYERVAPYLLNILSEGPGETVQQYLLQFIEQAKAKTVGWVGIAGLLFTAITTYFTILTAFNRIFEIKTAKPILQRLVRALVLFTVGPVLVMISLAVTTVVATQVKVVPFSGQIIAYLLTAIVFSLMYSLVPMVRIPYKVVFIGSMVSAALLEIAKFAYAFYTTKMVSYSTFYGSFAAVPLFLLWIYVSWLITLFGAVWIHTLQIHNKKKESL